MNENCHMRDTNQCLFCSNIQICYPSQLPLPPEDKTLYTIRIVLDNGHENCYHGYRLSSAAELADILRIKHRDHFSSISIAREDPIHDKRFDADGQRRTEPPVNTVDT